MKGDNNMVTSLNHAIAKYNAKKKCNAYIIGFLYADTVFVYNTKVLPHKALYMDCGNLRMHFSEALKRKLIVSKNCTKFCSLDKLITYIDKSIKCNSLGEAFERMITEYHNQKWYKDYVPFYKGNDLTVNDIGYSIKFANKCTIARQKSLQG